MSATRPGRSLRPGRRACGGPPGGRRQWPAPLRPRARAEPDIAARVEKPPRSSRRPWVCSRWLRPTSRLHAAALRREALARSDLEAGIRSESAGEFAAAAAQFSRAIDRASAGGNQALRQLAVEAEHRRQRRTRGRADARPRQSIFPQDRADPLSPDYRTCALNPHRTSSATRSPNSVSSVRSDGPTTPSSTGSTRRQRQRLIEEVNEVLFLWVIAADQPGDQRAGAAGRGDL